MERPATHPTTDPATWVDEYGDYLYRYALGRVRNPDAAEELVQEAFLAALAGRDSFRGRATERSWLTAILKRKVIDWLRQRVRRRATEEPNPDRMLDGLFTRGGKWKVRPDDWSVQYPGYDLTGREFRVVLAGCLDKLPVRLRQTFVLRHLDERSVADIRAEVGATETNVGVMLHRARVRLWRCLTIHWFEDDPETPAAEDVP